MIFADKLIALRKKAGWSQEELAAKLNVSRQSVSKWEGAQSVPDIERILLISRLFGVSTDYLLKDELGEPEYVPVADEAECDTPIRRVSMEDAARFLDITLANAPKMALGVFLCVISPVCLMMLAAMSEVNLFNITEGAAAGTGIAVLLVLVAVAVSLFISCASRVKEYEFLENENIETEYGVRGMVTERRNAFKDSYTRSSIVGCALCILAVIPVVATSSLGMGDVICIGGVCMLLLLVGIAAAIFVRSGTYYLAMSKLLEDGDYTREKKKNKSVIGTVSLIYWLVVTAVFLIYTFGPIGNGQPRDSWIIWAVGGVLYAAVIGVVELIQNKK